MTNQERMTFMALEAKLKKTNYRIDFVPANQLGGGYWEFYYVDEKGYEYGRENFFSIISLKEEVEKYLQIIKK
jgi:hypothetical protein